MWSPTLLFDRRAYGPEKLSSVTQKDFCNSILPIPDPSRTLRHFRNVPHFRTHASQQFRGGGTASSSAQGRARPFSGNGRPAAWVAADVVRIEDGKLAEHWDVPQDEAPKAQSVSGLPMFGDRSPTD